MAVNTFYEGVRPGGLTTSKEISILLCFLLNNVPAPVTRAQLEEVLLGEELANYFALAESLTQLVSQSLVTENNGKYTLTEQGKTVAQSLAQDVPKTIRDLAVRGVIRAQQLASRQASHQCEIQKTETRRSVICSIQDPTGTLFKMELYMPDDLTAKAVKQHFVDNGDTVYKLVLAALTGNQLIAQEALGALEEGEKQ